MFTQDEEQYRAKLQKMSAGEIEAEITGLEDYAKKLGEGNVWKRLGIPTVRERIGVAKYELKQKSHK